MILIEHALSAQFFSFFICTLQIRCRHEMVRSICFWVQKMARVCQHIFPILHRYFASCHRIECRWIETEKLAIWVLCKWLVAYPFTNSTHPLIAIVHSIALMRHIRWLALPCHSIHYIVHIPLCPIMLKALNAFHVFYINIINSLIEKQFSSLYQRAHHWKLVTFSRGREREKKWG